MTKEQSEAIKKMVDEKGWPAVRADKELGPIWAKVLKEQREFEARIED